jgi:hypothetical protein
MTPAVTMFIHEHDHILSLAALHANSRTKEKTEQKLHKLTPESSDLTERAEPRKKKIPLLRAGSLARWLWCCI